MKIENENKNNKKNLQVLINLSSVFIITMGENLRTQSYEVTDFDIRTVQKEKTTTTSLQSINTGKPAECRFTFLSRSRSLFYLFIYCNH